MSVDRIENESNIWPVSTEIKVNWGDMDALDMSIIQFCKMDGDC